MKTHTWRVEGTEPATDGRFFKNVNLQVIASTLQEAVDAVSKQRPDFRFVKVLTDRWIDDVIVVDSIDVGGVG